MREVFACQATAGVGSGSVSESAAVSTSLFRFPERGSDRPGHDYSRVDCLTGKKRCRSRGCSLDPQGKRLRSVISSAPSGKSLISKHWRSVFSSAASL